MIEKANDQYSRDLTDMIAYDQNKSLHESIRDKIEKFHKEIDKLEFEINGQMCSLRIVNNVGWSLFINSALGAGINFIDLCKNPSQIAPRIFLGLDLALVGSGGYLIKSSIDSINALKLDLEQIDKYRITINELRDSHQEKYNEYLEKK